MDLNIGDLVCVNEKEYEITHILESGIVCKVWIDEVSRYYEVFISFVELKKYISPIHLV